MNKIWKIANLYIAALRQMYLIHQINHWTIEGESFYSDHLLFERLYKSAQEDADLAAEKMIGLFGPKAVDYEMQSNFMKKIADKYSKYVQNPFEMSLMIEKDFIILSNEMYDLLNKEKSLSLGLDDMIMSIYSKREESCYLLQQILNKNS